MNLKRLMFITHIEQNLLCNSLVGQCDCRFYPGTADALKLSSSETYIVTTKQVNLLYFSSVRPNFSRSSISCVHGFSFCFL